MNRRYFLKALGALAATLAFGRPAKAVLKANMLKGKITSGEKYRPANICVFFRKVSGRRIVHYPLGRIEVSPGVWKSCEEYAREILDKAEAGAVYVFPKNGGTVNV